MGLNQRIIEVTNKKKLKKIMSSDLWTKYIEQEKSQLPKEGQFDGTTWMNILIQSMNVDTSDITAFNYEGMKPDEKKMKKDGFSIVRSFRKNSQLQGWFEKNYSIENLRNIRLTEHNINKLLLDIENKNLEVVEGFFYGEEEMTEEERIDLVETLKSVKKGIVENNKVYLYTCWY